ncbi:cysteine-rich motor neuron 1 protein-like isoform X2 [Antedon mediterranea]|uniref:cysteine-rich motor neuron 1 protein-like isoform X2 n=1 Tax=Antedon mediterranea TaxID=105859 RepID=UPI003AF6A738
MTKYLVLVVMLSACLACVSANRCRCKAYRRSMLTQYCSLRTPKRCPGGAQRISDMCGCCDVCPKMVGQSCMGPYGVLGACKRGLTCTSRKGNQIPYTFGLTPRGKCRN